MKIFKKNNCGKKFFLGISLVCIPMIILICVFFRISSNQFLKSEKKATLEETNTLLVKVIDTYIQDMRTSAYYIASSYDVRLLCLPEYNGTNDFYQSQKKYLEMATTVSKTRDYDSIYLFVPENGLALSQNSFDSLFVSEPNQIKELATYNQIKNADENFGVLSSIERIAKYTSNLFGVYYRLNDENYLAVTMSKKCFADIVERDYKTDFDYVVISDAVGDIVYTNKPGLLERNPKNRSGSRQISNSGVVIDDVHYMISSAHSKESGWTISTFTNLDVVQSVIFKTNIGILLIGIVFIALLLLFSYFLSKQLSKNANRLANAMQNATYSDPKQIEVIKSNDEFEQLSILYNDMIRELLSNKIYVKDMEIRILQQQINPHFLYNTFDVISYFILNNKNETANEMIEKLCDIFRYNVVRDDNYCTTVEKEIENLRNYLYIHEVKNQGQLKINWEIYLEILQYSMPKFILQPIAENAFSHGFKNISTGKILSIKACEQGEDIVFEISDNGQGVSPERLNYIRDILSNPQKKFDNQLGIGLININSRLSLEYGEKYGICIESELNMGTKIMITIPKR